MSIGGALMVQRALREARRALPRPRFRRGGRSRAQPRRILATRLVPRRTRSARMRAEGRRSAAGVSLLVLVLLAWSVVIGTFWFGGF